MGVCVVVARQPAWGKGGEQWDAFGHSLIGSGDLKQEEARSQDAKEGRAEDTNVMELNSLAS